MVVTAWPRKKHNVFRSDSVGNQTIMHVPNQKKTKVSSNFSWKIVMEILYLL